MPKLIYRIVSACGALGYGYPKEPIEVALKGRVNAASRIVGTFFVDNCNAIKISVDRPNISVSMDERDVFGAQQQAAIEHLNIPVCAAALAKASSF
jgi:superfamily II DNA helicase RecQ